jgi:hypothetical protein
MARLAMARRRPAVAKMGNKMPATSSMRFIPTSEHEILFNGVELLFD